MRYEVTVDERRLRVELLGERFTIDDRVLAADVRETVRGRQWSITLDGTSHEVTLLVRADRVLFDVDGRDARVSIVDERAVASGRREAHAGAGRVEIRAPMPGLLKAVHVKEGDVVERDAPLATLEAMKMENELLAPLGGRVTKLAQSAGARVEGGAVLIVIAGD
jgi:3-methylcrotonyl-CoA carboxylase alpha subunit